ncbi:SH3 domain-containing protein [Fructilactobacillus myrtifloralis]|uniref:SH3 domain-containing protein n=1 Tax=Fructilactobacillus myrtifloralis TaxID=2940301 RepID=A0ABY5BM60_9LACO|nr:SH3 domain-containing protein [Fructilactobacillus myrtifloralis]USS84762.1 SH3 domain-containing protein [Fructilactobacillus myrtifloralis]
MALATGETKTRAKLTKSKHGWLKIAMGLTFASTSMFAVTHQVHAEVQTTVQASVPADQTTSATADQTATPVANAEKAPVTNADAPASSAASDQSTTATDAPADQTATTPQTDQGEAKASDQTTQTQSDQTTADTKATSDKTQTDTTADQPAATSSKTDADATTTKQAAPADATSQPSADAKTTTDDTTKVKDQAATDSKTSTDAVASQKTDATPDSAQADTTATKQTDATKQDASDTKVATDQSTTDQTATKTTDANKTTTAADEHQAPTTPTSEVKSATPTVRLAVQTPANLNLATANMTPQTGTYTASGTQNVRDGASLSAGITGQLQSGDSINYDGKVQADGYTWLHYYNYENKDRWVAQLASATTSHQQFIESLSAGAIETWKKYGVLPSISIAQAIVESAWGQAAPGNNLFGIKGSYNGQSVTVQTQEWVNGRYITIYDKFRAYPSFAESIQDHGAFLYQNSRYANLLGNRDYAQTAWMLQNDGYATSPTYANTLISVIQSNNLSRFDQNLDNPGVPNNSDNNSTNVVQANGTWTFSSDVNVRTAPSLSASVTGAKYTGQQITYDGLADNDGYTWMRFKDSNGAYRYAAQIGANADVPAPTPTPDQGSTNQTSGVYTVSGWQNVRNGASLSAGITGQLQDGDTIYYDGTRDADGYQWLHYKNYAGQDRWLANLNNGGQTTPAPDQNHNDQATNNEVGVYTVNGWQNVRNGASLGAGVTGQLQNGDTIYYDGTRDADGYKWLHYTNYAGQDRWVADLNNGGQSTPAPAPDQGNQTSNRETGAYTVNGWQNVRTGSSLSAGVTGQLQNGDTIYYDETREADGYKWLHYTNYAGQDRWVADLNNGGQSTPAPAPSNEATVSGSYTINGWQNVRNDASLSAGVTGQLQNGDTIYYDRTRDVDGYKWLHYTNYAGQDRWVAQLDFAQVPNVNLEVTSNLSQRALQIASAQAGRPYAYGGATPQTGFDCSGLIYYAYQQAGKTLPRTAAAQYGATQPISKSQAQAGDLVFFDDGGIYHNGIYLGNGRMLDAQNNGVIYNDLLAYFSGNVYFGRIY